MKKTKFSFKEKVWIYPGESANWHFVYLSKKGSEEISKTFDKYKRGWGSLPVSVKIGQTSWKTSIFPDKKSGTYLLPLKAEVRKKEGIFDGDRIDFSLDIMV